MSSIWEITNEALEPLTVPMAANAFMVATGETLPDVFMVYSLVSAPPVAHAEEIEILRYFRVQVTVYSRSGLANLPDVAGAMTAAGFTRSQMRELPYNQETRHYALAMEFIYLSESDELPESY